MVSKSDFDVEFSEGVGQRIRALREKAGYSQRNLVDAANSAHTLGWHQTTLAKTEAGERPLRFHEAVCLARILGVDVSAFDPTSAPSHSRGEVQIVTSRLDEVQRVMEQLGARRDQYQRTLSELRSVDIFETDAIIASMETMGERVAGIATGRGALARKSNPTKSESSIVPVVQMENESAALIMAIEKDKAPDRAPGADAPPS